LCALHWFRLGNDGSDVLQRSVQAGAWLSLRLKPDQHLNGFKDIEHAGRGGQQGTNPAVLLYALPLIRIDLCCLVRLPILKELISETKQAISVGNGETIGHGKVSPIENVHVKANKVEA
jgi:hypothetical protein